MASNPRSWETGSPADVYERWAAKRQTAGYVMIGLAAALAIVPITNVVKYHWQSVAVLIWGSLLTLLVLASALYYLNSQREGASHHEQADQLRKCVLVVLGGGGLLTALLGLILPFAGPPRLAMTDYAKIFQAGVTSWRQSDNAWALARVMAALLGGLVLMFLGLIQARAFERTRAGLRRLLYGYNAVLSTMLLILIVCLINLLPYSGVRPFSYANEPIDWTRTGLHTLHQASRNLLIDLKQPVKVYLLGSSNDMIMKDMADLLDRCRAVNPQQFSWEQLSRDRNSTDVRELVAKYNVPDSQGVLVVYGSDKLAITDFIRRNDLFKVPSGTREARYEFKGENALLNALIYLTSAKSRAVVCFTQGNGELNFKDRVGGEGFDSPGMGRLIEELERINYQPRELTVTPKTDKIPDDADIVAIVRPAQPVPGQFIKALRDYLHGVNRKDGKKGTLMVLFDVVLEGGKGTMLHTGLENLVAEYGIRVNDDQLLNLSPDVNDYLEVVGTVHPNSSNPIARAFLKTSRGALALFPFTFYQVRSLQSARQNPPGAPAGNEPDKLIISFPQSPVFVQTDLSVNGGALLRDILNHPRRLEEARANLTLAMAASEGGKAAPPIRGHEFMAEKGEPRVVVFGDASWISNGTLRRRSSSNFNLFASCLAWLAHRPDLGDRVPTTEHDIYELKAPPGSGSRLLFLPGILMVFAVFALGLGVWVVRRR